MSAQRRIAFGGRERDLKLEHSCLRINGYLNGLWRDGCTWWIWDKHKFAAATKKPRKGSSWESRPLTASYLEKVFRVFRRRYADLYDFERVRVGRSWRWKVILRDAPKGLSVHQVTVRLAGYARQAALQKGSAHVDRLFLERFAKTAGLPLSMCETAAKKLRRIRGCRLRRRGSGNGKKLVVSLLQSSPRHSSPYGEKRIENSGRQGAHHPQADPAAPTAQPMEKEKRLAAWCLEKAPIPAGGRYVRPQRLAAKAACLAFGPMRDLHAESPRVLWRMAHARNFAYRQLRDGHSEAAILEAWRHGLRLSSYDAVAAGDDAPRQPSATVVYAVQFIARDRRTRDERWRDFFAQPRRQRPPARKKAPVAPAMPPEKIAAVRLLERALAERGLSTEALMRLPAAERDGIVRSILGKFSR